jgi:hypothetical protein
MVVNKRQMATNARMRLYDELLPRLERTLDDHNNSSLDPYTRNQASVSEVLSSVRRAGAIAGRQERRAVHNLALLWSEHESVEEPELPLNIPLSVDPDPPIPPGKEPAPGSWQARQAKRETFLSEMREEVRAFSDYLGAKLG